MQRLEDAREGTRWIEYFAARGQLDRLARAYEDARTAGDLPSDPDDPLFTGLQVARDVVVMTLTIRARHEHRDVAAENLVQWVAEQPFNRRVGELNDAAGIDHQHGVDRRLENGANTPAGLLLPGDRLLETRDDQRGDPQAGDHQGAIDDAERPVAAARRQQQTEHRESRAAGRGDERVALTKLPDAQKQRCEVEQ